MRFEQRKPGFLRTSGLALVVLCLTIGATYAATAVPTETIIVPADPAPDAAMPGIPPDTDGATLPEGDPRSSIKTGPLADGPVPIVEYDFSKLPVPVARLRSQIMEAAATGDIEKLRPIIDANGEPPAFSFDEVDDPIAYLKSTSGDDGGREILAVLTEVLEAGYVHADAGTKDEMYVWPYFALYPVDKLTPPQLVELFKLVYAGDYEDMKTYGTYLYYRVGIAPDGTWRYFISGD